MLVNRELRRAFYAKKSHSSSLSKPSVMFNHYDTAWDALFIELYGKETVVLAHELGAAISCH